MTCSWECSSLRSSRAGIEAVGVGKAVGALRAGLGAEAINQNFLLEDQSMSYEGDQKQDKMTMKDSFNLFYQAALAHATCIWPFMRKDFGREFFGMNALYAILLMTVMAGLGNSPAMVWYFFAWIGMVACQRARTFQLVRQGWREHSKYWGYPALAMTIPGISQNAALMVVEPMICMIGGTLLCYLDTTVGGFVILGMFSGMVVTGVEAERDRKAVMAMEDAEIDMQRRARMYRERKQGH